MTIFGPSGNSNSFYNAGLEKSLDAPYWLFNQGLLAYEYSFGKGITIKKEMATLIGQKASEVGVQISVHAPYFINFASTDDIMIEKSIGYVIRSAEMARCFKSNRVIFHAAAQGKSTREEAFNRTKENIKILIERLNNLGYQDIYFCPETMGKSAQIGTYQEIIELCELAPNFIPTFDFGHINALYQGGLKSKQDYLDIFNYSIQKIGYEKTKICHIHFSKIEYGLKGEIKHLTFEDEIYGPNFEPLSEAIKELKLNPVIICESKGTQSDDAIKMKNIYENY